MRASLKQAIRARHDPECRFGEGLTDEGRYVMICSMTCAINRLGNGNTHIGVDKLLAAEAVAKRKIRNRKLRKLRKKRRGWI
jgi:hypothetical protein